MLKNITLKRTPCMNNFKVGGLSLRLWLMTRYPKAAKVFSGSSLPKGLCGHTIPIQFPSDSPIYAGEEKEVAFILRIQDGISPEILQIVNFELELLTSKFEYKYSHHYDEVARQINAMITTSLSCGFYWWRIHFYEVKILFLFISVFKNHSRIYILCISFITFKKIFWIVIFSMFLS